MSTNDSRHGVVPKVIGIAMMLYGIGNFLVGMLPMFGLAGALSLDELNRYTGFEVQHASEIMSIFIGLVLIGLGLGLLSRRRGAWFWSIILQAIVFVNSCLPAFNFETLTASILFCGALIIYRKEFYVRNTQSQGIEIAIAWMSVLFALLYGILGSYFLRDQFSGIHNYIDAVYFTVVTYSTVGYGDITPITPNAKMFTISMIIIGITSFVTTLTVLIAPIIQSRVRGVYRIMNKLNSFTNHIVLCGYNDLSRLAATQLVKGGSVCLFLEKDHNIAEQIRADGFNVVTGDSSNSEQLASSNFKQADTLICADDDDAVNILTLMAAAELKENRTSSKALKLVVRIEEPQNVDKAKRLGADTVISPAVIGGDLIAKAVHEN